MATLTSKKRNALPATEFALPKERKYPLNDRSHAINAKARSEQMENQGRLSPSMKHKIDAKANKVIRSTKSGK